ncbi:MAG: hypothetical protein FJ009_15345 [Chloroflexi bacterium]|nr:hypothetical protein [Chloroflexota bacterium]
MRKHIVLLIAYTLVALVMTYPLALNFATAIPGVEGDAGSFVWALGWMKTALVDLRVNPFHTDYVFYPLGGATQVLWAVSLIAFISIPLQYAFGLIVTHNILYLAATVGTAWGTYLLAEEVLQRSAVSGQRSEFDKRPLPPFQTFLLIKFITEQRRLASRVSPLAPFVAGLVFAFAPLRLGYGIAFFNLFNTQLIPFYALFLIRALRDRSRRDAIVAGVLLGLNAYIDFQIAAFLVLFTGLYFTFVVATLVAIRTTKVATIKQTILIALVSLLVVAPMLALLVNDFAREGGNYIRVFPIKYSAERSYDLFSFFVPNARNTFFPSTPVKIAGVNAPTKPGDESALSPDRQAFVGYIALALAAYATIRQWRRARFWFFAATLFALFALGPALHIFGRDTNIPLPYLALHQIPIVNHIRIPMRYGIVVMFALAMLVALAIYDLQKRLSALSGQWSAIRIHVLRFAFLLLPFLILLEYAALPYPIQPITIPRVYNDIARVPGDFTILEIPTFNWRYAATTEMYQAIHGKRILRAYTNRIAPGLAEYFGTRGIPIVVRSLRALEGAQKDALTADEIAEDRRARDDIVRFYDLRYAVVHRDLLPPDRARAIEAYLRDVLAARVIADEGATVAYGIPRATTASDAVRIDLRELSGQMYAGRGWQFEYPQANWQGQFNFVWTRGAQSEIYFVLSDVSLRAVFAKQVPSRNLEIASSHKSLLAMTEPGDRAMTLHARAESPQRVVVWLNDARVGEIALTDTWQDHRVVLPARALKVGMNRVRLEYSAELEETIGVTTITIE